MHAAQQPRPGTPIVDYDPYTEAAILDAHRCDGALRDEAPVAFLQRYGIWAVSGHEECKAVLADHETFSSAGRPFDEEPGEGARPGILVTQDPPEHTRARAVLHRTLSPRRLRQMRDMFEAEAGRQLDALLAHGPVEVDGHEDLAQPFVLTVFPDLLGLPQEGRDHLRMFGDAVFNATGPHNEIFAEKMQSASEAIAWVDQACLRESQTPGSLGEEVYAAVDAGEIDEAEAFLLVKAMFAAGFDTTIASLGSMILAFAEHPDQWEALQADEALARNAFEEVLRYYSPSRSGGRVAAADAVVGEVEIPAGARVLVLWLAAGRDPRHWERAESFDIRRRATGHLNLGYGIHACVGQALARVEGAAMLSSLLQRVRALELTGPPRVAVNMNAQLHDRIPVRLHPR